MAMFAQQGTTRPFPGRARLLSRGPAPPRPTGRSQTRCAVRTRGPQQMLRRGGPPHTEGNQNFRKRRQGGAEAHWQAQDVGGPMAVRPSGCRRQTLRIMSPLEKEARQCFAAWRLRQSPEAEKNGAAARPGTNRERAPLEQQSGQLGRQVWSPIACWPLGALGAVGNSAGDCLVTALRLPLQACAARPGQPWRGVAAGQRRSPHAHAST